MDSEYRFCKYRTSTKLSPPLVKTSKTDIHFIVQSISSGPVRSLHPRPVVQSNWVHEGRKIPLQNTHETTVWKTSPRILFPPCPSYSHSDFQLLEQPTSMYSATALQSTLSTATFRHVLNFQTHAEPHLNITRMPHICPDQEPYRSCTCKSSFWSDPRWTTHNQSVLQKFD